MKKFLTFFSVLILVLPFLALTRAVSAQDFSSVMPSSDIAVEFSPTAPAPNQTVTATASSESVDLNSSKISWSVNGKTQKTGTGVSTFSFTVGALGRTTTVSVTVNSPDGQTINKSFSISPADVDLVWQAVSYTPPFYEGKALFSYEERIEFIAIPHILNSSGAEIPASQLNYKWSRGGYVLGDFSGYGKNTYTMISSVISLPADVQVEVTTTDGTSIADSEAVATPVDPQIVFYQRDPLYGILFQRAVSSSLSLSGSELDVLAEPFYFANEDVSAGNLQYTWSVGGEQVSSDLTKNERVFRPQSGASGTSNISLSVGNTSKILQMADSSFNLSFSSPK